MSILENFRQGTASYRKLLCVGVVEVNHLMPTRPAVTRVARMTELGFVHRICLMALVA